MTQAINQDKLLLEGRYTVESPEQVEIDFELAGPGSRFCALLIDVIVMFIAIIVVIITAGGVIGTSQLAPLGAMDEQTLTSWILAVVIVVFFLLNFGYFLISEWLLSGRSAGKLAMQLRAVRDDGTPMGTIDILLRNLLRVVDAFPLGYVVGGAVAFFHPLHKRLGDLAAGTIVIKERQVDYASRPDKGLRLQLQTFEISNPHLSPAEKQLLMSYFRRRGEIEAASLPAVAYNLAAHFAKKHAGDISQPDQYLDRLARGGSLGA